MKTSRREFLRGVMLGGLALIVPRVKASTTQPASDPEEKQPDRVPQWQPGYGEVTFRDGEIRIYSPGRITWVDSNSSPWPDGSAITYTWDDVPFTLT